MQDTPATITRLLLDWRAGSEQALDELVPLVYAELKGIAAHLMIRESGSHTLQSTALLHEAYGRLVSSDIAWQDRTHFFAVAARTMRRVLTDHARAKGRIRRGGEWKRELLHENIPVPSPLASPEVLLALDDALQKLQIHDERKAQAVELHYFGGMNWDEIAEVLQVSRSTVAREIRFAKAWLLGELQK